MSEETITKAGHGLSGAVAVPGDKSVSHRAVLFASVAEGKSEISGFLKGQDCLSTISCMRQLGVHIEEESERITVYGNGPAALTEPEAVLDAGNSGTTVRLLSGILAGLPLHSVITGDESIARRPMSRVTGPLRKMGARIDGRDDGNLTPLSIRGGSLKGISYSSPVASAQVKSAILLAGLFASGETTVNEPFVSRDHTERMLRAFGAEIRKEERRVSVTGGTVLKGRNVRVPGDISSAAFFIAAALITPGSDLTLTNVGMNPTRSGIIDVVRNMGGDIEVEGLREENGEPAADLRVKYSKLTGTTISGEMIPRLIDEIPVISVLATQAEGTTVIRDAAELKVKETNRIDTMVNQLRTLGADVTATEDGMIIKGRTSLNGGTVSSFHDHRVGMSLGICGLISSGPVTVQQADACNISYPGFFDELNRVKK
ncbi:3-phosphoshikimate 1-carboxyvinyltransferase [Alteribacter natronophilus]|uniref:3-phosphoshikimate 1-carboxyvinyltransferase n=1 Tax=Alteribacter natronophilus TaxID=2583810 RepID=UPI00110F311E|nr:3-phosphoshikimate 1-carboxyvinyltransferase [Alteribacter natronophilus]TMW73587.1 3-phosphoshikimate 1-carboxyvinyltransferase [Alteribacter natronophilus]